MPGAVMAPVYEDDARKRRAGRRVAEPQPAAQEPNVVRAHRVLMPPARIGACRQQVDRELGFTDLREPRSQPAPVRWIAKDALARSGHREPICSEERQPGALGLHQRTWVEREPKLLIERAVELAGE
jgi:hypothetical protein